MTGFGLAAGMYLMGGAIVGAVFSWLLRTWQTSQQFAQINQDWRSRIDEAALQNEHLKTKVGSLKQLLAAEQARIQKYVLAVRAAKTELESRDAKETMLSKNLFTIGAARDELKNQMVRYRSALDVVKKHNDQLKAGLDRGNELNNAQLETSIEECKILQRKLSEAKFEHQSLNALLASARSEYDSVSKLLTSAQSHLRNLKKLDEKVAGLEAENVKLEHKAAMATREAEMLRRSVDELDELKAQNSQLVHCLESMDSSRKQHEEDARRFRSQYEESEKESDTLRFRIGDIQKDMADRLVAEEAKINSVNGAGKLLSIGLSEPDGEVDDLKEIIGIGKKFEQMLHELGIFHFRQIAAFGTAEIARINSSLKEFTGRIEHDDWIGQARDMHFKKYGDQSPSTDTKH